MVAELARQGGGWIDSDTYVVVGSYEAALRAAGGAVQATSDVVLGKETNAMVLVRPPGHHATRNRSMGFCLFNSIAIAAQWAIDELGIRRVAIVDVDVHHGNGTQDIFYDRSDVLYCSLHQYPHYPGTGALTECGAETGLGTTVNVPLMPGCGDQSYAAATARVVLPSIERFAPELVLVSLGFDAHWADPMADMQLSLAGYSVVLSQVLAAASRVCAGRAVFLLEGGYDVDVLSGGVVNAAALLAGASLPTDPLGPSPKGPEPYESGQVVDAACRLHGLS